MTSGGYWWEISDSMDPSWVVCLIQDSSMLAHLKDSGEVNDRLTWSGYLPPEINVAVNGLVKKSQTVEAVCQSFQLCWMVDSVV